VWGLSLDYADYWLWVVPEHQLSLCVWAPSLDYADLVVDGLYDIWGEFPEFRSAEGESSFPTLTDLKTLKPGPEDTREV
jgi:hypothetical protein